MYSRAKISHSIILAALLVSDPIKAAQDTAYRHFDVPDSPLAFQVPSDWEQIVNPQALAVFLAPDENGFRANFAIRVQPYNGKPAIEAFRESISKQFPPNVTIATDGFVTIDGSKSYFVKSDAFLEAGELVNVQYYIPRKGSMYMLTFMSDKVDYDQYAAILSNVIESIRFE